MGKARNMRIAVLGWGSLCWDSRKLRMRDRWHTVGPLLPIEFARVLSDGRLTLVLFQQPERIQVLWAQMETTTVNEAIDNLRQREETNKNGIGCIDLHNPYNNNCKAIPSVLDDIKEWAENSNFDAAIWTDLPANFHEKTGMVFNEDNVISYLSNLDGGRKRQAEKYIRKAPRQVRTKMRSVIEGELGWSHSGNGI